MHVHGYGYGYVSDGLNLASEDSSVFLVYHRKYIFVRRL